MRDINLIDTEKQIERDIEEINRIAKKTDRKRPILAKLHAEKVVDEYPELSFMQHEYHQDSDGHLIIENSCQFTQKDVEESGTDEILEYIKQDERRLEQYGRRWWMEGVQAQAEVYIPRNGHYHIHKLTSGGLYGIWSDADEDYFEMIGNEETDELVDELKMMNVIIDTEE